MAYGRSVSTTNMVYPTRVTADGEPLYKAGGMTLDFAVLPAAVAGADVTLPDGSLIKIGSQYLRYGQVLTKITATGKFGPYDPAAADGRQLLARGDCVILDMLWERQPAGTLHGDENEIIGMGIEGGSVWIDRVLHSGAAGATLALGPTLVNLLAAFPLLQIYRN